MRLARQTRLGDYLEWQPGAILYRSAFAALAALFLILAAALRDANRTAPMMGALVFATVSILGLLSWRVIYQSLLLHVSWRSRDLRSRFRAMRLTRRADRIRTAQTQRLLSDLEHQREYLKYVISRSTQFRELMANFSVVVFRGQESPLATLIFSDSLEALGFHVEHFENLLRKEPDRTFVQHIQAHTQRRLALILGRGTDEQTAQIVSYLTHNSIEVVTVPFYSIQRYGLSLFREEELHDIPTDLYLNLKGYIERAASLGEGPSDTESERRPSEVPPVYR